LTLLWLLPKNGGVLHTLIQTKSDVDKLIIEVVGNVLEYCLGESNASLICTFLEKRNCSLSEIPNRPDKFSEELRNILGFGSRQILGAPSILEEEILEILYKKLGICHSLQKPPDFPREIRKLRETYGTMGDI
jgi:hypothetical protein